METKLCMDCKEVKPLSEFYRHRVYKGKQYYQAYCKPCTSKQSLVRAKTPKAIRTQKNWYLKKTYGITLDEYEVLADKQNNACAICGKECATGKMLAVDHNHKTGKVRGLLCFSCNIAIGHLAVDDGPELLSKAINYII